MKTTIIIALTALTALTSTAQAGYRIVIPLEQSNGGSLPNGSINITPRTPSLPVENWQPAEPVYGNWINYGVYFGCDNEKWTGNKSGDRYRAINSTCKINQTRTVQDREFESTMLSYRDIGEEKTKSRTLKDQTYTNIGECMYANDASNPSYYNLWNWYETTVIDNITYYSQNIRFSPNGQVKGFGGTTAVYKSSLYNSNFNDKAVYFRGDYKTQIGGYAFYELCFIDITN